MNCKSRKFAFQDRLLEVRAVPEPNGWRVRVYECEELVVAHSYVLSYETEFSGKMQRNDELLVNLMNLAQSDVESGIVRLYKIQDTKSSDT